MRTLKKAFKVWHDGMISDHPDEGYRLEDIPHVFAESPSKAKSISTLHHDFELDGRESTYTDLKVQRDRESDIVLFNGAEVPRHRATAKIERNERESRITRRIEDSKSEEFYLQTGVVGNCLLFWAKDGRGYTCHLENAHVFSKEDALNKVITLRSDDRFWESDVIMGASTLQVDHQKLHSFSPMN